MPSRAERNLRALDTSHLEAGLGARTARGGLIGISTQLMAMAMQIANAAVMARLLEPADFGLIAMAMVVTGFIMLFQDLGLSTATIQRKVIDQDLVSGLFLINVAIGVVIMLASFGAAPVAAWAYDDPRVMPLVMALAATIPLSALGAQHRALMQRRMMWNRVQALQLVPQFLGIVAGILAATLTDLGYWALVLTQWVTGFAGMVLAWAFSGWWPSRVSDWSGVRAAVGFGANLTLFSFANWFNRNLDNALIGWRWGPDELGFYTRAYTLLMLPMRLVSGPVTGAVLPALSRLQDQPERWRDRLLEAMGAVFFISSGLTSVMIAAAEPMILVVYGPGWEKAADIFQILLFAMYAQMIANLNGWIYISTGRTGRMAVWGLIYLPIVVAAFAISLPFGAIGVAKGFTVATIVALVPCVAFASHGTAVSATAIFRQAFAPVFIGLGSVGISHLIPVPSMQSGLVSSHVLEMVVRIASCSGLYIAATVVVVVLDPKTRGIRDRAIGWRRPLLNTPIRAARK